MALAKQIQQFRLVVGSTNYDLNIQNMDFRWEIERFTDADVALDGTVLSDNTIAGRRLYVDIRYDQSIEPTTWDNMSNAIISDSIYGSSASFRFYPDQSQTSDSTVATHGSGSINATNDTIRVEEGDLVSGTYVKYNDSALAGTVTGLTDNNFYYIQVDPAGTNVQDIAFSTTIFGTLEDLTGVIAVDSPAQPFLFETTYVDMAIDNIDELQAYQNTISSFRPSIRLKSLKRFVTIPSVFYNV